jgi:hypothetical protein
MPQGQDFDGGHRGRRYQRRLRYTARGCGTNLVNRIRIAIVNV